MSSVVGSLREKLHLLKVAYDDFFLSNIETVTTTESVARTVLYLVPGRLSESEVVAEGAYSLISLLSLYHDVVYMKAIKERLKQKGINSRAATLPSEWWLTISKLISIVTCFELFLEILAKHKYGIKGKWKAVVYIEIIKAILKLYLLKLSHGSMIVSQTIPSRDETNYRISLSGGEVSELTANLSSAHSAKTKHPESEHTTEDINITTPSNPSSRLRPTLFDLAKQNSTTWKNSSNLGDQHYKPSPATPKKLVGELLYIARPLIYLLLRSKYGSKSWTPLLGSAVVDISSRSLAGDQTLNDVERDELQRRINQWLYYFLRSPLYESFTSTWLLLPLAPLRKIERFDNIVKSLLDNVEAYRQYYFYYAGSS